MTSTNPYGQITFDDVDAPVASGASANHPTPSASQEELVRAAGLRSLPRQREMTEYAGPAARARTVQLKPGLAVAGGAAALLVAYILISSVAMWLGMKADDLSYGRPRTFQLDAYVGHNESAGNPSHFIAINLNHQVVVIELPGGDVSKARSISGPYLFGSGEDLTPVTLEVRDVNGDQRPDLLVDIKREQIVYINSGADFHLITAEERAGLPSGAAK